MNKDLLLVRNYFFKSKIFCFWKKKGLSTPRVYNDISRFKIIFDSHLKDYRNKSPGKCFTMKDIYLYQLKGLKMEINVMKMINSAYTCPINIFSHK